MLKSIDYIKHETYKNLGIYIGLYKNSHLLFVSFYHASVNPKKYFTDELVPKFPIPMLLQIPTIGELKLIMDKTESCTLDFKIWTHFHVDNLYYWPNKNKDINLIFVNRVY